MKARVTWRVTLAFWGVWMARGRGRGEKNSGHKVRFSAARAPEDSSLAEGTRVFVLVKTL